MRVCIPDIWSTYDKLSKPAKASLWYLVCNILQMSLNVLTTPIFTRLMSPEEFGVVNIYNSWRCIFIVFTSLNLFSGVFNNAMLRYPESKIRDAYISSMQGLYVIVTLVVFGLYLLFKDFCISWIGLEEKIVILLFVDLFFSPAFLFWSNRQKYEYQYKTLITITVLTTFINIFLGVFLVIFCEEKAYARILAMVLGNVVFGGIFFIYQFIKGRRFFDLQFWKYALSFNLPLIPHYLSELVLGQSDRIMINYYEGESATANYSIAYSVVVVLQLIMQGVTAAFVPFLYEKLQSSKYEEIQKCTKRILYGVAGCIVLVTVFAPQIVRIYAGRQYSEAIYVIPSIAFAVLFMFFYELFSTVEFYFEKKYYILIASFGVAAINLILNYIFIPRYGYYAAGYTTLFCYALNSFAHYVFYSIIIRKNLDGNKIYDEKEMFRVTVFTTLMMTFILFVMMDILERIGG